MTTKTNIRDTPRGYVFGVKCVKVDDKGGVGEGYIIVSVILLFVIDSVTASM